MNYTVPHVDDLRLGAHCCKIGCDANATWELTWGPTVDDYTHSCDEHFGELLGDQPLRSVLRLENVPPDYLDIVLDGPPGPFPGRFVEVEASYGAFEPRSVKAGEWIQNGMFWRLHIPVPAGCVWG